MKRTSIANDTLTYRITKPQYASDPLATAHTKTSPGRWNAPGSHEVLYLNEDKQTARHNAKLFFENKPYEPTDLRPGAGPVLAEAVLPEAELLDVVSPAGVEAVGLPATYPRVADDSDRIVPRNECQPIGAAAHANPSLSGIRCRSAATPYGEGREIAWFPRGIAARPGPSPVLAFEDWFWN